MKASELICELITKQEQCLGRAGRIYLSDAAFDDLADEVREWEEFRRRQHEEAQAFLVEITERTNVRPSTLALLPPKAFNWEGTVFGLPLERVPQYGYHIGVR